MELKLEVFLGRKVEISRELLGLSAQSPREFSKLSAILNIQRDPSLTSTGPTPTHPSELNLLDVCLRFVDAHVALGTAFLLREMPHETTVAICVQALDDGRRLDQVAAAQKARDVGMDGVERDLLGTVTGSRREWQSSSCGSCLAADFLDNLRLGFRLCNDSWSPRRAGHSPESVLGGKIVLHRRHLHACHRLLLNLTALR